MPADINTNSLSALNSGKGSSVNARNINTNQLFSDPSSQSFNTQLEWELAKTQQIRSQPDTIDRQRHDRSQRSDSSVSERNPQDTGNDLPRHEHQTRESSIARKEQPVENNESRQKRVDDKSHQTSDRASDQRNSSASTHEAKQQQQKQVQTDRVESQQRDDSNVEQAVYDKAQQGKSLNEKELEETTLSEAARLESQLVDQQVLNDLILQDASTVEELAPSKPVDLDTLLSTLEPDLESEVIQEQVDEVPQEIFGDVPQEILKVSQLAHDIKAVLEGKPDADIDEVKGDGGHQVLTSIEDKLKALLENNEVNPESEIKDINDSSEIKLDIDTNSKGEALPDSKASLESIALSDSGAPPNFEAPVQLEEILESSGLPESDIVLIQQALKENGVLNKEGNIDTAKLDTAQRVVSQLINDRLSRESVLSKNSTALNASDTPTDVDPDNANVDGLLKVSEKLNSKLTDQLAKNHLEELKVPGKPSENLLQQKLEGVLGQVRGSLSEKVSSEASSSSSSTANKAVSSSNPTIALGVVKANEATSQNAVAKPFSMTMQNHFSKQGWGPEVGQRLMMMVTQKIQVAEIRLDPPDLGPMEVKVKMQQDQANVVFNTPHAAVKDALEQAMPKLKELFEQNGLSLGDVDVQDNAMEQRSDDGDEQGESGMSVTDESGEEGVDETAVVAQSDRLVDYYA